MRTICGWQLTNLWRQSFESFFLTCEFSAPAMYAIIHVVAVFYFSIEPR